MPLSKPSGLVPPTAFDKLWGSRDEAALRVLAITRNFPNREEPLACAFQRQQLACLGRRAQVEILATVPWVPGAHLLGERIRAGRLARLPRRDALDGLPVVHPRVPYVPGTARVTALAPINAPLYLAGLLPYLPGLRGRFDVVLGTHLFPDAWAAVMVARILGLRCVVKAHGTDVNVVARWPSVRPFLSATLRSARFAAGVSRPLVEELVRLGAPRERAVLLPNGVDRALFHPRDRGEARRSLGLPDQGRIVLYVGELVPAKGLRELFEAHAAIAPRGGVPVHLVVVGAGPLEAELRACAAAPSSRPGQVVVAGAVGLPAVAQHLGAADLLVLPSWAEGTPNVVLEALAAGRPVVASRIGGIPDILVEGVTGLMVPPRDPAALARALHEALGRPWDEAVLVASAPPSWDDSASKLLDLLWEAARGEPRAAEGPPHLTNGAAHAGR
jgi:glycosyltransferase involved in cell wall biosynthesis